MHHYMAMYHPLMTEQVLAGVAVKMFVGGLVQYVHSLCCRFN
jgi:hypothetical protein